MILLTPAYVDISKEQPFIYKKNLSVINSGANIQIDITKSNIKNILSLNSIAEQDSDEKLDSFLKKCTIKIYGVARNKKLYFKFPYIAMVSNKDIRLQFSLENTTDIQSIDELRIGSSCLLDHVKVYWKNYSK
jgi:hypothetical protein